MQSRRWSGYWKTKKVDVVYADMFVVDHNGRILQRLSKPDWSFQLCLANWYHLGVCRLYKKNYMIYVDIIMKNIEMPMTTICF